MMKRLGKYFKRIDKEVMGINERNIGLIYPFNERKDYKLADDKLLAKEIFEANDIQCPQTYGVIRSLTDIEPVWERVKHRKQLVIKPAKGAGGKGIMILKRKDKVWFSGSREITEEKVFHHIANVLFGIYSFGDSDKVLVEEFITPHDFFHKIYEAGVPDFRIILLQHRPLMAMLRMPTARSGGKANLHQGGLGIGVDLEKGILKTAYDGKQHLTHHPDSDCRIEGLEIPYWNTLLNMSIKVSKAFPLQYLGVDLVIDQEKGPMLMEVNVRPGLGIQLANREGLKRILETIKLNDETE